MPVAAASLPFATLSLLLAIGQGFLRWQAVMGCRTADSSSAALDVCPGAAVRPGGQETGPGTGEGGHPPGGLRRCEPGTGLCPSSACHPVLQAGRIYPRCQGTIPCCDMDREKGKGSEYVHPNPILFRSAGLERDTSTGNRYYQRATIASWNAWTVAGTIRTRTGSSPVKRCISQRRRGPCRNRNPRSDRGAPSGE